MKQLNFKCTFKSDVVLHATSNTEGRIEKLNYIPGSNFLGMVARAYGDFGSDAFDIFHSGNVCFSDGHMMKGDSPTLHIPYSWYAYKGVNLEEAIASKELYNHHFLTQDDYASATSNGKQYKQQREGFLTLNGEVVSISHNYKQKSAFDKTKRRSRDSMMYGYHALPSGTQWAFSVMLDESMVKYEEKIKELLCSANRLGKSKSAEYGLVKIEFVSNDASKMDHNFTPITIDGSDYLLFYAKSRLLLTDGNGVNSYKPSIDALGFKAEDEVSIDWDKSQIRIGRYTPYVGARANFDPERLYIDKGSVLAVKIEGTYDKDSFEENLQKPLGLYISEGHGEVVINHDWLKTDMLNNLNTAPKHDKEDSRRDVEKNVLNTWLSSQRKKHETQDKLMEEVLKFRDQYNVKNKKSQWGQIRSLCRQAGNSAALYDLLFDMTEYKGHPKGYLVHGRAMDKWDSKLIDHLKERARLGENRVAEDYKDFMKLLSIYAPKLDDESEGARDE